MIRASKGTLSLDNGIVSLTLREDANWAPASFSAKSVSEAPLAGTIRVGYFLEDESYVDERRVTGPGEVTPAETEVDDRSDLARVRVSLNTKHFEVRRSYEMRPGEPFVRCVYELTPRPVARERGGRLDMPLVQFGDGIESPMTGDNDRFRFPVDLGGGPRRAGWRVARDPARERGLGLLAADADTFVRTDVAAAGFALRSHLFRCFWKDSDSQWRIGWSDDPSENTVGTQRAEFLLFPYEKRTWRADAIELFAGATYGPNGATWVGPDVALRDASPRWSAFLPRERKLELTVPLGGSVTLLALTRDGAKPGAAQVEGDGAESLRAEPADGAGPGRRVRLSLVSGEPGDRIEASLRLETSAGEVTVPLAVRVIAGELRSSEDDGVVVRASDIPRPAGGEWRRREDVPSLGGPGALEAVGWESREPLVVESPVEGLHAVVAGIGAGNGVLAHVPAEGPLRARLTPSTSTGAACVTALDLIRSYRSDAPPAVECGGVRLRPNEVYLGTADLSGKRVTVEPLHRFPEIAAVQYLRFAPVRERATEGSPKRFRVLGLCDVFDIAHTCGPSADGETYRASVRQHAEAGFDVVAWQSMAGRAVFPGGHIRPFGVEAMGHHHYIPACRAVGQDIASGLDPLAIAVEEGRQVGVKVYGWLRPHLYPPDVLANGHEWRAVDYRGRTSERLSLAYEPVRAAYRRAVMDVAEHGVEGLVYDLMRHPPLLHYGAPLVEAYREAFGEDPPRIARSEARNLTTHPWLDLRAQVATDLLRAIRRDLETAGRGRIAMVARIEPSAVLYDGCDLPTWVEEGLARDFLCSLRMAESASPKWGGPGRFDATAFLDAFATELAGLPRQTREALFAPDVRASVSLECLDTTFASPADIERIAEWARAQGFIGLGLHESNLAVMQPGKTEALRRCAALVPAR